MKPGVLFFLFYISISSKAQQLKLILPIGHNTWLTSAHFSPNGKKILTVAEDATPKIWDANSGSLLVNLIGHKEVVVSAKFSPACLDDPKGGKRVVTISLDSTAKIWDITSGRVIASLNCDAGIFSSAEFSPDGNKIITTSEKGATIWDAFSGSVYFKMNNIAHKLLFANFSPDSKKVIIAYRNKAIKLCDAETGKLLKYVKIHIMNLNSVGFSPDGTKIITFSSKANAKILEAPSGKTIANLNIKGDTIILTKFSYDGKKIVTISNHGVVKIWDADSGNIIAILKSHITSDNSFEISRDGKKISISSIREAPKIWSADSGTLIFDLNESPSLPISVEFSADSKDVVTFSGFDAKVWNIASKKTKAVLKGHTKTVVSLDLNLNDKELTAASYDNTAKVWNILSCELTTNLKGNPIKFKEYVFSLDGKKEMVNSNNEVVLKDITTGKTITRIKEHHGPLYAGQFSCDSKKFITTFSNKAIVWDASSGTVIAKLLADPYQITCAQFYTCNEKIVTATWDGMIKVWDLKSMNLMYSFVAIDSIDFFVITPDGYYKCTPSASKLLKYVSNNLNIVTFAQLDIKNNRPDKVLRVIGCPDTLLIDAYREAYFKRVKKLEIDTTAFRDDYRVPECDFANRDSVENEQKTKDIILHITGLDSNYQLDRANLWINEVPVFGQKGLYIRGNNSNKFDTSLIISLSLGQNRIETAVRNTNGIESYRSPLYVNYTPEKPVKGKLHFIGIGISSFADSSNNLAYSVKDIRDLARAFKQRYGDDCMVDTLMDEQVTVENVRKLKAQFLKTDIEDKVIVAYSGHGLLSSEFDYFLSTYRVDFSKPEQAGLPYDDLESLLDSIPARKKLLLIDACHSGEFDKEDLERANHTADSLGRPNSSKMIITW